MKKSARFLSLLLCAAMLLSLLPAQSVSAASGGTLTIDLYDSCGDGWNGNAIKVYEDGELIKELTIDEGYDAQETIECDACKTYEFVWVEGEYAYECSYEISYNGEIINRCDNVSDYESEFSFFFYETHIDSGDGVLAKEATCEEGGYYEYTCELCSQKGRECITPNGHCWDDGVLTQEATCEENGVWLYTCLVCGETKEMYEFANGHSVEDGEITLAPTCTDCGIIYGVCVVCGELAEAYLSTIPHTVSDPEVNIAPTCTDYGELIGTCSVCGEFVETYPDPLGHTWQEGAVLSEPTCTSNGEISYVCTVCGDDKVELLSLVDHTPDEDGVCTECYNSLLTIKMYDRGGDGWGECCIDVYIDGYWDETLTLEGEAAATKYIIDYSCRRYSFIWYGTDGADECSFEILRDDEVLFKSDDASALTDGEEFFTIDTHGYEDGICRNCEATDPKFIVPYPVEGGNIYFDTLKGLIADADDSITSAQIPAHIGGIDVVGIGYRAFCDCSQLASVVIPESIKSIGEAAFSACDSLAEITIPATVETIDYVAFMACDELNGIWVDEANPNYSSDEYGVLFNKDKTELHQCPGAYSGEYAIPEGVTEIRECAFIYCYTLTGVTIPDSVTTIGASAFYGTALYKNESNWVDGALYIGKHLIEATLTSGDYTVKAGTLTIADCALLYNENLSSVTLPEGLRSIGESAFECCSALTEIVIPDSVETIEKWAFSGCAALRSVKLGNGIKEICKGTFSYCSALTEIVIPDGVTSIGDSAFYDCDALETVVIGDGVTSIGETAFTDCESLKSVTIGKSVALIGHAAFHDCGKLSDVYYNGTKEMWNKIVIDGFNTPPLDLATIHFAEEEPNVPTENPFKDVKEGDYFATPVLWAVGKGITNGLSATSFGPNENCTRGQIVTFLWRANGSPEPTKTENPFKDVKSSDYYYKAVLWAVENGITTGLSATSFGPNATCTRGQVATFLWRAQGEPAPTSTKNPFGDIDSSDYYYKAVLWAVENKITYGVDGGIFAPNASCTRGQIVTFLYRAMA